MREGWKEVKIGDYCRVLSSKRVFANDYVEKGIPFYRSKEIIHKATGVFSGDEVFISEKRFREFKEKFGAPIKGDILMSSVGNRSGVAYFVKEEYDFYFKDGNLIWMKDFSKGLCSKYLEFYLRSQLGEKSIESMMIGAAQKALTIDGVKKIKLNLPPLETQRKIACILSGYDDLIENNLKRIKILEEMAQQTYKEWFVRMRFPGYETAVMNEETGLPEGWEKNVLKSFCTKITKGTTPTSLGEKFVEEGVKFIKAESYTDEGCFIEKKFAYIDEETHELLGRSKLERNDILVSIAGVLGRVAMVNEYILPANTNQAVGIVRINSELTSPYFIKYFLNSKRTNILINTVSGQAAQPNINLAQLGSLEILTPHKIIVEKFHDIIEVRDKLQIKLHRQNQSLREARDLLLPRLMMGIVEV